MTNQLTPDPMKTRMLTARLDPELYGELKMIAKGEHRTVNNLVTKILIEWKQTRGKAPKPNGAAQPVIRMKTP